jgi:hypothetical protein
MHMNTCKTKPPNAAGHCGCLVETPTCGHASRFGFSYYCVHPERLMFRIDWNDSAAMSSAHSTFDELRRKRREEFIASLEPSEREFFIIL